ncbi:MAG: hypothetical protein HY073_05240 [Deltaproteobacteria bacterium]|nr:hypothetical protein [Deltaproteobacteria bacterium]
MAFHGLDGVMERASSLQKEKAMGQESLFGFSQAPTDFGTSAESLKHPEWTTKERLTFEKESLGFYITGHPLNDWTEVLRAKAKVDTQSIKELVDQSDTTIGGVVSSLREIVTKSGSRMGFVTLEDLKGTLSVTVFPELYQRIHSLLASDDPILVRGTVEVSEDSVKMLAKEIAGLRQLAPESSMSETNREVHFRLSSSITRDQLENLKSLLKSHRGRSPAYIHLIDLNREKNGETILELPEGLRVNPSEQLAREVDGLFGASVTILQ